MSLHYNDDDEDNLFVSMERCRSCNIYFYNFIISLYRTKISLQIIYRTSEVSVFIVVHIHIISLADKLSIFVKINGNNYVIFSFNFDYV